MLTCDLHNYVDVSTLYSYSKNPIHDRNSVDSYLRFSIFQRSHSYETVMFVAVIEANYCSSEYCSGFASHLWLLSCSIDVFHQRILHHFPPLFYMTFFFDVRVLHVFGFATHQNNYCPFLALQMHCRTIHIVSGDHHKNHCIGKYPLAVLFDVAMCVVVF